MSILKRGSTSVILHMNVGVTGLAWNTASITAAKVSSIATVASLTLESIAAIGTWVSPTSSAHVRFKELDATKMPGIYEIHCHNDWFTSTCRSTLAFAGAAGITAGKYYDFQVDSTPSLMLSVGYAQAAATQNITLAASETSLGSAYVGNLITIVAGTGMGQTRIGIAYNTTTKVLSVDCPWSTVPDTTSKYEISAYRCPPMDGNLSVPVQSISAEGIDAIWEHGASNVTDVNGMGYRILQSHTLLTDADAIETGWSFVQTIRVMLAVLAGDISGAGSTTEYIKDVNNTKDRVLSVVDENGNRSVTYDKD